ncbi:MAG: NADPH:quinone reductase, partial [Acidimicrobiia bacterium]|nr:NADPH:quinone reductase [Acidimicrobiia bacterium]
MKAIAIADFGAVPTLHDLPVPQPGEGDLLVRVEASSVNGFDLAVASGKVKGMMEYRLPIVLGRDFAGTVEAVGPGVTGFAVGDPVFGVLVTRTLGDGTFAEHVAVPAMFVAKVPEGLPMHFAGALGAAGATAMDAIDAIDPSRGETVLISGATGGVG